MVKRIITGLVGFVLLMSCFSAFGEAKPKKICEIEPRENIVRYTYVDQEGKATEGPDGYVTLEICANRLSEVTRA